MKTPVVIRDDYVMYLEWFDSRLWFHTDVFKWSSKIKKTFVKDLTTLQSLSSLPLNALVEDDNTKLAKFASSIGFIQGNKIMTVTKTIATIYVWGK